MLLAKSVESKFLVKCTCNRTVRMGLKLLFPPTSLASPFLILIFLPRSHTPCDGRDKTGSFPNISCQGAGRQFSEYLTTTGSTNTTPTEQPNSRHLSCIHTPPALSKSRNEIRCRPPSPTTTKQSILFCAIFARSVADLPHKITLFCNSGGIQPLASADLSSNDAESR
jgi:hypothetical protein